MCRIAFDSSGSFKSDDGGRGYLWDILYKIKENGAVFNIDVTVLLITIVMREW